MKSERMAFRVSEATTTLGISRSKMYGLIKRGQVRVVYVGEVMRVRVQDLEAYLDGQQRLEVTEQTSLFRPEEGAVRSREWQGGCWPSAFRFRRWVPHYASAEH